MTKFEFDFLFKMFKLIKVRTSGPASNFISSGHVDNGTKEQ